MVEKFCSRSHGQPLPGVRSIAMISSKREISREGVIAHLAWRRSGFMPQDGRPSQRNEPNVPPFPQLACCVPEAGGICRTLRSRAFAVSWTRAAFFTLLRRAATHEYGACRIWTPDQRRTAARCAASGECRISRRRPKILRLQFDWRTVRRAIGGVVPGIAIAVQGIGCRDALGGNQSLQRRQPVPVIGLASIGIAPCLRPFDFVGERLGPFVPRE